MKMQNHKRRTCIIFLLTAFLFLVSCRGKNAASELTISAAADLTPAFQELGTRFEKETSTKVTFNFGSTGQLAQQIEQGAPVDLFAAANVSFIEELEKNNLILSDTKAIYAQGRITIWTRKDSSLTIMRLEDLKQPSVKKFAIANPDHAPYGIAAREALQSAGVWDAVKDKIVFGENIRQTLQYAESGNVDAAIAALSLSIGSDGRYTLISAELHKPLNQALAVIKGARNESAARHFAAYVNSDAGRTIMRKYGFILPGEETAK